ncbi:methionine aminopeptidase, type II [Ignisphaera aggregans DSM 17230]|uniref:Methionine aminopeptidase n=1 Tax=Ignisphaera aggregans (strain DSM 17230 / JCM 13409 / AQ1.S1) TaxID=583356 RepID=E0SR33_IGNAA|nr:methionine aminopeptidase, type II [Ignisphaera aggregans DSM 17230]
MDGYELESYIRAGRIACIVRKEAERIVREGARLIDIANHLEKKIVELGGYPAFPVNISVNEIAAHYTPLPNDSSVIPSNSVVKIDIGVHVDGYIADTAITISLNDRYIHLVEAVKEALEKALKIVGRGVRFSEVGGVIESIIKSYGYKPIVNLSGHSLDRYVVHAGSYIPNFRDRLNRESFKIGRAYAIEPFATDGIGYVENTDIVTIYALKYNPKRVNKLSSDVQKFYNAVYSDRRTLPFTIRWYIDLVGEEAKALSYLNTLQREGLLIEYPVLVERGRGIVAQYEHTIVIDDRGEVLITTDNC